jgi:hypothetical protein
MRLLLLCLLIFNFFPIYGISNYQFVKVGMIPSGDDKSMVKCFVDVKGAVGHMSPTTCSIDSSGKIFIGDDRKKRIAIYNLDFSYIGEIKCDNYNIGYSYEIKSFKDGSIATLDDSNLLKVSQAGIIKYRIGTNKLPLNFVTGHNFYPSDDNLIYYDDKGDIRCFDTSGKDVPVEEVKQFATSKNKEGISGLKYPNNFKDQLNNFLDNESLIIKNKIILSKNTAKFKKYYKLLNKNAGTLLKTKITIQNGSSETYYYDNIKSLIGYDSEGNAYWNGTINGIKGWIIFVISNDGSILDVFNEGDYRTKLISPNGDIYSWEIEKEEVAFYKISRQW